MTSRCSKILWVLVLLAAFSHPLRAAETAGKKTSWNDYKIISERNIFSRNRRASVSTDVAAARKTSAVVRPLQSYFILRGIARQDDNFVSFIEDSRTGQVKRVRKGERIGGGTVETMTLNGISFVLGKATTRVAVGKTLAGRNPETSSAYNASGGVYSGGGTSRSYAVTSSGAAATVSKDKAGDILKRLMERRKKELGE